MKRVLIIPVILSMLIMACGVSSPFLDQSAESDMSDEGSGLRLNLDRGRTILPDYLDAINELQIDLENLDTGDSSRYILDGSNEYIIDPLDPGAYSLVAEARNSLGQLILSGSVEHFEIEIVGLVDVYLPLFYSNPESGEGSLDISWTFRPPAGSFEPHELTVVLIDVLAHEWDEAAGDPEPYGFQAIIPFEELDDEWQQGYFSWTSPSRRAMNKLDRAVLHLSADAIPTGHYHIGLMVSSELEWGGGMDQPHSIYPGEIGEPLAYEGGYYVTTGPMLMWMDTIRVEDGVSSQAHFDLGADHFGPMPVDISSLSAHLDWVSTDGMLEYRMRFFTHESNMAYRIEEFRNGEWLLNRYVSHASSSFFYVPIWTKTQLRMRPESFVGAGAWYEFSVDGDPKTSPMQVLSSESTVPYNWSIDFDLAPFSSTWLGVSSGSGELGSRPSDLYAYDMLLSGQILLDTGVDSFGRLWATSSDSGAYQLEMVRDLLGDDPLAYSQASVFLELPDLLINSISNLAVDPEGEWLFVFGESSEEQFALGASTYHYSPTSWGWEQHVFDIETIIGDAIVANTSLAASEGFQVRDAEVYRNELHLIIEVTGVNELTYLRFDLAGMPQAIDLSAYSTLQGLAPADYNYASFGIANQALVLLYSSGAELLPGYALLRFDPDAELLIEESSFSPPHAELIRAAFSRGTAAKGERMVILDDGDDYFFYRITSDFSIDPFWDELLDDGFDR